MAKEQMGDRERAFIKRGLGRIEPIGETNTDSDRLDNLHDWGSLLDSMIEDVIDVSKNAFDYEYSRGKAGEEALAILKRLNRRISYVLGE